MATDQFHIGTDLHIEEVQKDFLKLTNAHNHLAPCIGKLTADDPTLIAIKVELEVVRFYAKRIVGMADDLAKRIGNHINRPTARAA